MRIRTKPRADIGVSPYEMMFGLPFLTRAGNIRSYEEGEQSVRKYVLTITSTLKEPVSYTHLTLPTSDLV